MRFKVGDVVYREMHGDILQKVKIHTVLEDTDRYRVDVSYNNGYKTTKLFKNVIAIRLYLTKQEFYTKRIAQYNHERDALQQKIDKLMVLKQECGD